MADQEEVEAVQSLEELQANLQEYRSQYEQVKLIKAGCAIPGRKSLKGQTNNTLIEPRPQPLHRLNRIHSPPGFGQ
eukprot:scaffold302604_cov25-Prasinocladus_malaysianus.AAC.4